MPPTAEKPDLNAAPAGGGLTSQAPLVGIALKVISTVAFFVMVTLLKMIADTVPIGQVVFARNFFGMFPVLIMVAFRGELAQAFSTTRVSGHIGRAMVGTTAMVCSFLSYQFLPLADATAIGFATPLMVVVLAFFLLGEPVRFYRWSAVLVGFAGILVILSPHLGEAPSQDSETLGAFFGAMGALFAGLAMIFVRKLCETERTSTIVTWFAASASVFSLFTIPLGFFLPDQMWILPDWYTAGLLIAVGLSGGVGQILLTQSYRYADASTIAPFDYINMLWAIAVGWLIFSDTPSIEVLAGSGIVIAAGIFVIFREHRLGIDRTRNRRASTPSKS
ncbi:DMT family transporter [Roseibium sediminis]|uniref:DMT family transporter n=1 Tax=Roseibium sediminis TaxID=1775174 RepID=UPI001FCA8105|nr:DMT family transporter [Roseibium sediminis]